MMRIFLIVATLLLGDAAQAAKPSATPNRYGAIAYHRASQSWGVAYDTARSRDAEVAALKQCDCWRLATSDCLNRLPMVSRPKRRR